MKGGKCDFCNKSLEGKRLVDGRTVMGPWATMCESCHEDNGVGFGIGRGQLFDATGKCIRGGSKQAKERA